MVVVLFSADRNMGRLVAADIPQIGILARRWAAPHARFP
jgi:hypothetical protein